MTPESPIELFYSYAQEDEKWCVELEKALSVLRRHQIITWSHQQIIAGQDRMQEIDSHLNAAQVILLLISRDYLASDYCYTEMQRVIERHRARTSHVIPILLSSCDWQSAPCAHLQPLPMNMKPITLWSNLEEALLNVAQGIRRAIENLSLRPQNEEKTAGYRYDVFLCYNTESREDKRFVEEFGNQLRKSGVIPWFGDWEVRRGASWQDELEQQIEYISSAAVFVGEGGYKHWERLTPQTFLGEFMKRERPIIYIYLPNVSNPPPISASLLKNMMGPIDFRGIKDIRNLLLKEEPFNILVRNIKRERVQEKGDLYIPNAIIPSTLDVTEIHVQEEQAIPKSHVLITSLGTSPLIVSAMYDLLTKKEGLTINKMIVLCPEGEDIVRAYKLIRETLTDTCQLQRRNLPFEDIDNWTNAFLFLRELYFLLDACQTQGDNVYLSLTGGREGISTLLAWVAPFFSCIKHLYYAIDLDEEHFLSIDDLELLTRLQRKVAMRPDPMQFALVDIPFESRQQINQQRILRLLTASEDELATLEDELEGIQYEEAGKILEASVTEGVMKQFRTMIEHDGETARRVKDHLERMRYTGQLRSFHPLDSFTYNSPKYAELSSIVLNLHLFRSSRNLVHVIFYTLPKDIYTALDDDIDKVVICELGDGKEETARNLQDVVVAPDFPIHSAYTLDMLPSVTHDSVLIVPLGETPMVATQLFTLLERQEGQRIRKVVLVYPEQASEIANGADLIEKALQEEAKVPCIHVCVPDLADIDSPEACRSYQTTLEATIEQVRQEDPAYTIDLALSGGRKGMTAMTIFAAQKKQLPYIYHRLIVDEQLGEHIDQQTTVEALSDPRLGKKERNGRLFLQLYEKEGVYTKLQLIKIPVFFP